MRDIKFRVWMTLEKQMRSHDWLYAACVRYDALFDTKRKDIITMQFTGLKDENEKEIYECDIVEIEGIKGIVRWAGVPPEFYVDPIDEDAWLDDWTLADDYGRMKVVGNIYEPVK